jgi:hypothetical protein
MRLLIALSFLLFTPGKLTEDVKSDVTNTITVLQVNSKWNKDHNIDLNGLINCTIKFGWLEDQNGGFKEQVQTVPIIIVYKGKKPVRQWAADLSFKLDVDLLEIQKVVDRL